MACFTNRRVLVVDDDPNVIDACKSILLNKIAAIPDHVDSEPGLKDALQRDDWEISVARQGLEAVELVRQSMEQERPFGVALVDIRMPPGIDGIETARRMREIDPALCLVIASAYASQSVNEMKRVLERDFFLLRKPFVADEVYQAMDYFNQARDDRMGARYGV